MITQDRHLRLAVRIRHRADTAQEVPLTPTRASLSPKAWLQNRSLASSPNHPSQTPGVVLIAQSGPSLCDPTDCSSPGSFVHGILPARILKWVIISSFRLRPQSRTERRGFPDCLILAPLPGLVIDIFKRISQLLCERKLHCI